VAAGIIEREAIQILDSTAIWGRGAVEDTYNLLGSAVRKLLGAVGRRRRQSPREVAEAVGLLLTAPADSESLKGRAEIDWSAPEERRAFLNRVVEEARTLLGEAGAEAEEGGPEVAEAAALLRRVLCQDLEPIAPTESDRAKRDSDDSESGPSSPDPRVLRVGTEVEIRRGVAKDRIVSISDPEMRHGHKSPQRTWDGFKAHLSVEAGHGFTTAVEVTPANVPDAGVAPELIRAQKEAGLKAPVQVGDMAYSSARLRVEAEREGTKIVARVPTTRPGGRFAKSDFQVDLQMQTATCPAGHTTRRRFVRGDSRSDFGFDGELCASCPLRERCTPKSAERMRRSGLGRTISIHPLEPVLQQARREERTPETEALLKLRVIAERTLAHQVARGLRQARYFGRTKVKFQALTIALVANLARLARLLWLEPQLEAAWVMAG
jgi:hypothetical protein